MDNNKSEEYNMIPVWYCNNCMSLKIINSSGSDEDFEDDQVPCHCGECYSCDIETTTIDKYLELKKERKK